MEVLPHDNIENCNESGEPSKALDMTGLEVIIESDNDFYLNGTVRFLIAITAPWEIYAYGERFYRNSWVHGAEKKMRDFCAEMEDKSSPAQSFLKDKQKCPFRPGVSEHSKLSRSVLTSNTSQDEWKFDMFKIPLDFLSYIPPNFSGRWRLTEISTINADGSAVKDCFRMHADLIHSAYAGWDADGLQWMTE